MMHVPVKTVPAARKLGAYSIAGRAEACTSCWVGGAVQKSGNWRNPLEPAGDATTAACGLEQEADGESGSGGRRQEDLDVPAAAAGETD